MTEKNKVEVRIAGKDYTLVGVESEEYIQRIGLYIDKKMNEVMKHNSRLSTSMAAVLTAINIADDFFKTYESEKNVQDELKEVYEELDRLREENHRLSEQNTLLNEKSTNLQLELAKREAELNEVRNTLNKANNKTGSRFRA